MEGSGSTTSSMTSNTLTHTPAMAFLSSYTDSSRPNGAADILALFETIKSGNRHAFLQPTPSIPNASLQLAKSTLDAYAARLGDEQQLRLKESAKKRKRAGGASANDVLKIRKLHVDGFENGQIWQQARRIIASTLEDSSEALQELEDQHEIQANGVNGISHSNSDIASEIGDEDEADSAISPDELDELSDENEAELEGELEGEEELSDEDIQGDLDDFDDNGLAEGSDEEEDEDDDSAEEFVEDPDGVNDGFFSIDAFNKQTQWFEDQDAKANPNTDQASEDEDFDWHADLSSKPSNDRRTVKKSDEDVEDDMFDGMEEEDEEEEAGPTFGDMDLDAPEGASDIDDEEDDADAEMDNNANDVFYKDFFAPPRRKGTRGGKPQKWRQALELSEPKDHDVERAMEGVRRDLFDDESEREDSEDALSDVSAGDPRSRRSAHERRQAKIAEEIRKLEAANVAKREWTMAGEAKAADRPMNSLLEETLDFEHVGKPVPIITAEVTESIEDMIKRRILAQEFDEVTKRLPGSDEFSTNTRRGLLDVEDSKAKQGLAEIYEEEHVKNANPDTYVSKSEEKLRKEEKEIEQMWKEVSGKLDALSSWHYKPKPAAPSLTVVSDAATISMEDAQPTTAQGVGGGDNTLAPQEVYKAGKGTAGKGEVVTKAGLPMAREELSREDKLRRRRRDKERTRKAGPANGVKPQNTKAQARKDTLSDLKKGGVKVINKKGEVLDMDGAKAKDAKAPSTNSFKL